MSSICTACSSTEVEHDPVAGNIVCHQCGAVLEENTIVSEVQFSETASGASVLQGTFISEKSRNFPSFGGSNFSFGSRRFYANDSREWTIANARNRIQALAYAVQMSEHQIEAAHRWYVLALQHNFTRGRKSQIIAAACLYIVCRQDKTSHMLLDFSDVLQTNVFELGNMYLRLCRLLSLEIPLIDPSLYIGRFASKLEFGDKTSLVANTALRLVSRMKRDWIQTGRRPAGICGACILISARLYGFSRSYKEIVDVVRVCEMTLKKRLDEFAKTPSAKLTPEQFHGIWLEHEIDPPSFTKNRIREEEVKKKELEKQLENNMSLKASFFQQPIQNEDKLFQQHYIPELVSMEDIFDLQKVSEGRFIAEEPVISKGTADVVPQTSADVHSEDELLETLDEDFDIASVLLTEDEIEHKTQIWMESNKDFLIAQEERLRIKRENEDKGITKTVRKKRRNVPSQTQFATAAAGSASEALIRHLQSTPQAKKISKKFNYEALDSLLQDTPLQSLASLIDKSL